MASADVMNVPVSVSRQGVLAGIRDFFGDKRFVAGTVLGLSLLAGGYALSAGGTGGGGSPSDPTSQLLSEQESVITQQMRQDAETCAKGDKEGTVGHAIKMSLKAHLELASASPNVEKLFDVSSDCFAGLSSLIDLSFAIPSLATIISAAQNAVMAYAKKKICSAVSKVTGMVTGPINQAIGEANKYIGALNGLSANLSDGGLSLIDPNLGAGYNVGTSGSYTTGVPFGAGNPQAPNTGSGSSSPLQKAQSELYVTQDYLNRINAEYEKVKQNYKQNCQSSGMSCTAAEESAFVDVMKNYADSIKAAEDKLAQLKDEIDAIQKGAGSPQSSRSLVSPPVVDSGNPGKTLTQKMADIFQ